MGLKRIKKNLKRQFAMIQLNSRLPTLKAQPCLPSSKCKQKSKVLEESVRIIEGPYYKLLVINLKKQNNNFKASLKKIIIILSATAGAAGLKKTSHNKNR